MFEPIVINRYGVSLKGPDGNILTDEDPIGVLEHKGCMGFIHRHEASSTHDKLRCNKCELVEYIPCRVVTNGDLRRHFRQFNFSSQAPLELIWLERALIWLLMFVRKVRVRARYTPDEPLAPHMAFNGRPAVSIFLEAETSESHT